ncbi:septal ring lytic transglycosylase RlpA family protein [Nodosilinea sp. LEGE 06152]|uniref:septal ring lytic transglycosylase RlpA family protein n=1 Tax=Nodosilinea sp. LEGE 06152 TaxID=2777966 RepID=UPI0018822EDC|nr:septal ring lytic transglycosylase RlpA family protein [Nodosilinea sp. LEGE 06152]MBE9156894.1 septal ring lytic transglycosylase RlpA family protein [Nodosilinea sp. LEGE 06152]
MTLFGFLWAALLPHHLNQPVTLQAANPYAAAHLQRSSAVVPRAQPYSPLHLQASAKRPLSLQPQLAWPQTAAIDWPHWVATAAVAVVAQGSKAHISSGFAQVTPASGACGSTLAAGVDSSAAGFTIQVKDVPIGRVLSRQVADRIANQIRQAVPVLETKPDQLTPSLSQYQAAAQVDGKTVFVLPDPAQNMATSENEPPALQAAQWVNNLRLAFGATPLDPSQVQMVAKGLGETHQTFSGIASWYGPYFHGRQTATGETFNQHDLTAAHKTLPFGTHLKVRNQLNGKTVVVRINDRGPYIGERSLDLSYAAAQCLGSDAVGVIPYQATILAPGFPAAWREDVVATLP